MTEKPDYVLNFPRQKNTEIKKIGNNWYLYERFSKYDPAIKRSRKISGKCLGKITSDGLVATKRRLVDEKKKTFPVGQISDVVEAGAVLYFWERTASLRERLKEYFPDLWEKLYVAAVLRAIKEPRFRRLQAHYETSLLAHLIPDLSFDPLSNSSLLQTLGRRRETISRFMREDVNKRDVFILFDGHRLITSSKTMELAELGYDPEADLENTPDSVFCAHGAGFTVKWNQVKDYMHLESGLKTEKPPEILTRNLAVEDKELEAILRREFGDQTTRLYRSPAKNRPATEEIPIKPPKQKYILVDGYNMIFAWEELKTLAKDDLDAARRRLCDLLSSYAGFTKCRLVVVFDGYKQKGSPGEKSQFHNIQVVYTGEGETADAYLESLARETGGSYAVRVASSDGLIQLSSLGSGVLRMSARELEQEVNQARKDMKAHFSK